MCFYNILFSCILPKKGNVTSMEHCHLKTWIKDNSNSHKTMDIRPIFIILCYHGSRHFPNSFILIMTPRIDSKFNLTYFREEKVSCHILCPRKQFSELIE